ncbi:hypothetical protein [Clostridium folliculivorans]|uniref:Uncharacterized protein n=1 Tax=Clostridium folliculivorans TaxID=2886038 RepID=A0A9W6DAT2_9CLOT|nr:hypothetical protein [Clostridium folliculivorans]GKU25695.1 hypothetical protein CFOLD11_25210 [Clostridium folliculivorans]GKU28717.1 hypothetical protein CFB3_08230 [Clostridium folliculivorans]
MESIITMKNKKRVTNKFRFARVALTSAIVIALIYLININMTNSKCKDLNYATNHYMTTGLLNKNKVLTVNGMKLLFSDDNKAIVEVDGLYYKSPHIRKKYQLSLSKTKGSMWKLDDVKDISTLTAKNN